MNAEIVLPDNLPSSSRARLPELYEGAKDALTKCERIDECKDWADKMEAMASYAKQAKDDSLRKTADRIQARAIRRCGELLRQVPSAKGGDRGGPKGGRVPIGPTRGSVGKLAGLSRDQQKTALRVANVPAEDFEEAVESDDPPTVTELEARGKRPAPRPLVDLGGRSPADFKVATSAQGQLRELLEFCRRADPDAIARGSSAKERRAMRDQIAGIQVWLKRLLREIGS